ncbi:sodium/calcium exchanger 2b [Siniperca chuatsi]|uniref:sodium/calcium exchanger 2b n=1 Tax=Siniperca chuatsi TaxID=119488 RepID=UPI001CE15F02|nr:sodium/calcium exchanger 2b [Siniperca chuatsi]XP_044058579.1 sodium/calcium exchanger 2b [Siniperca chuatsi]XP_044058580.1 sodium/calcium exchanger 2b [Siniperca chuatsi]XP_044058581.1 sodium/calcium exchanger 2b [Siniperca chuatsi]XP_044058582.1 sodium/calcium exchanger 2b [Siniperca chuatsi]XP_044058583.1 sodium/calcium exchanger 2b [Siniperca chuatsi]XP_044058584.1 sodium/calcium exchanger 2b [Siniperca chuatsi]XP_044058585.1 sodium/calcium exchanger 2b [Siniperca chuatsi]
MFPSSFPPSMSYDNSTVLTKKEKCEEVPVCRPGILLPVWEPNRPGLGDQVARAVVYFVSLMYMFLGVSIIADRFMASIEVITSQEKEVTITMPNGETSVATVRIWNETVSNLTLMALGSSAPEILLSVIEVCGHEFKAGELGPGTIVGSAAFNMFVILGICVWTIPNGETRKIKHLRVFFITAFWSIFAYIWLYLILSVMSPGIVEVWEALVTLLYFPVCVILAWIADRRLLFYKYMGKRYRADKRHGIVVETEGDLTPNKGGMEMIIDGKFPPQGGAMVPAENCGGGTQDGTAGAAANNIGAAAGAMATGARGNLPNSNSAMVNMESSKELDESRKEVIRILKELKQKYPDKELDQLVELANYYALLHQQKSRAFYRIQATRMMIGAGNVLKKHAADNARRTAVSDEEAPEEEDQGICSRISFESSHSQCMENCGVLTLAVVCKGGLGENTFYVDYRTEDGSANAGSDYEYSEGTLVFKPGETRKEIKVGIIDDDIFEEDEHFFVRLLNLRVGDAEGMFESDEVGAAPKGRLVEPLVATVTILDDDHAGIFTFSERMVRVSESVGTMEVTVVRNSGARGTVILPYHTESGSAKAGDDYEDARGELEFTNDQTTQTFQVRIIDDEEYEKHENFFIVLEEPRWLKRGISALLLSQEGAEGQMSAEEEEARRIAEMGKPILGEHSRLEVVIEESYEFKSTVDKLIKKTNLALVIGTHSWREQFVEAVTVSAGDGDDDEEGREEHLPSCYDYVMHFLTIFWKVLFACVPPTEYWNGWACFLVSISVIGLLTAVIGDLASHFGCTVGLRDTVTAVVFVALGTSIPDTFASKVAAMQDQHADASIGNVTGSNAVNVFLGIGVAWSVAAIYWRIKGKEFKVDPGSLAFSVTLFTIFAFICMGVLLFRRRPSIGGELGGPRMARLLTSLLFLGLWFLYILFSSLEAYCHISGF